MIAKSRAVVIPYPKINPKYFNKLILFQCNSKYLKIMHHAVEPKNYRILSLQLLWLQGMETRHGICGQKAFSLGENEITLYF